MTLTDLLREDEQRLRTRLRDHVDTREQRERYIESIGNELGELVLKYNADCVSEPMRQLMADSMAAVARDELSLIMAGGARRDPGKRHVNALATYLFIAAAISGVVSALIDINSMPVRLILTLVTLIGGFISGRYWLMEREAGVHATLDADVVWDTIEGTVETMDVKLRALSPEDKGTDQGSASATGTDRSELALMGGLLEGLYSSNGDYAIRQLKLVRPYLEERGIELVEYNGSNGELFSVMPSAGAMRTRRPAMLSGGELILEGIALDGAL